MISASYGSSWRSPRHRNHQDEERQRASTAHHRDDIIDRSPGRCRAARDPGVNAVMSRLTHRNRPLGSGRAFVVVALFAVLLPVAGTGSASGGDDHSADVPSVAAEHRDGHSSSGRFELLQMNLCLSGAAGCFDDTEYPKVVDEAIARIDELEPDAVTINEACSGDVADIAAATGYHMRFATVIYGGEPFPCVDPGDRGVFGNAVLTAAPIRRSRDAAFTTQSGPEERRWICATTTERVSVCATHLSTRGGTDGPATNDAQCAELTRILRRFGRQGPAIFAGDVNRDPSCAPDGWWTLTDAAAEQLPGIQHAYGTRRWFGAPRAEIHAATYTDHDFLLATADRRRGWDPHR